MNYPYRSQWDTDGSQRVNDCGPACVCMVLQAFGMRVDINTISAESMPDSDLGTDVRDLVNALARRGVKATAWTGLASPQPPFMALVSYAGFDRSNVQDVAFMGWHWLLVLSVNDLTVVVHDPDYRGDRRNEGAYKRYARAEFDRAFIPYDYLKVAITWAQLQSDGMYTITGSMGANVRADPSNTSLVLGTLNTGDRVDVAETVIGMLDGVETDWLALPLQAGNASLRPNVDVPARAYVWAALATADTAAGVHA